MLGLLGACGASRPPTPLDAAHRDYAAGRETEARRALTRELAVHPNNLEARYDLAVLLTRIGHIDEARQLYEDNMQRGWHLPTVVNLSVLYTKAGESARAEQLLKEAARHFRHEAVPWYMLAEMAYRQGHFVAARQDFEQAIHADAKNGYAHIRYARFLAARGELTAALAHAERAVALLPDVASCWLIDGDVLMQAGKADRALVAYQKSAALDPSQDIRVRIIAALRKLGDNVRADHMQQALAREAAMHKEKR